MNRKLFKPHLYRDHQNRVKHYSKIPPLSSNRPIDPLGQPRVTAGSDHCFHTCCPSICPYVRPHFSKLLKQNNFQEKTMFTTGKTVGLAEWIIDYTCLVHDCVLKFKKIMCTIIVCKNIHL